MKSKKIILTALLLTAVLVSSCFAATTVASYKSTFGSVTETARVAKWAIGESTSATISLFNGTQSVRSKSTPPRTTKITSSANGDDIIAPGTSGSSAISFGVPSTAPEVAYKFHYTVDLAISDELIASSGITIKVNGTSVNLNGTLTDIDAGDSSVFNAGVIPTTAPTVTVEWSWPNRTTSSAIADDTALGNNGTYTVTVTVKATAEQAFG